MALLRLLRSTGLRGSMAQVPLAAPSLGRLLRLLLLRAPPAALCGAALPEARPRPLRDPSHDPSCSSEPPPTLPISLRVQSNIYRRGTPLAAEWNLAEEIAPAYPAGAPAAMVAGAAPPLTDEGAR